MTLLSRLAELLDIDLDLFFDHDENIEVVLARMMSSLDQGVAAAKRYVSAVIAVERQIARELQQSQQAAKCWQGRSLEAIAQGRHTLAQQAAARRDRYEGWTRDLKSEYKTAGEATFKAKILLRTLEDHLVKLRQRQRLILACCRVALRREELGLARRDISARPEALLADIEECRRELNTMQERLRTD